MARKKTKEPQKVKEIKGMWQPDGSFKGKPIGIPVSPPGRRRIRYICARYQNGTAEDTEEFRAVAEFVMSQWAPDMNWENFTITWDISHDEPYRVVRIVGGKFVDV